MPEVKAILLGAGQRGADAYATYALKFPTELTIVAVAEPDEKRREQFRKDHGLALEDCYNSWEELLAAKPVADCALICTQDPMHYEPTVQALKQGYHVLLEKPMSPDISECISMGNLAEKYNRILSICHVLRYTPFYTTIKEIIDSGEIGQPVSLQQVENVAYWHQAHSFVRGNWSNTTKSSPMILAKSCHDMDIILWLMGSSCNKVSSFGSLSHFKAENAPEGSPKRCLDGCQHRDNCPYYAPNVYLGGSNEWFIGVLKKVVSSDTSHDAIYEALQTGPYGRCVYHCDNDVVDHQVVNMEFENGSTAVFTMCAFTTNGGRTLKIMGTKGQIEADFETNFIETTTFLKGNKVTTHVNASATEHGGGDSALMRDFVAQVASQTKNESRSSAKKSVQSHLMAFAAEESRLKSTVVNLKELERQHNSN